MTEDNQYETVIRDRAECIESNYNKDKEKVLQLDNVDQSVSLARYRKDHEDLISQLI